MPIALLMFPSACAALQLRKVRTTFGLTVRQRNRREAAPRLGLGDFDWGTDLPISR
jgi:hypothetical protein